MIDLITLFPLAILSAVNQIIVPAPIDLIMLAMVKLGHNPVAIVLAVVIGSSVGAMIDYYLGRLGMEKISWIKQKTKSKEFHRAQRFYGKYGYWSLLFSYAPFIGKYFVLIAGIMKARPLQVLGLYVIGKLIYYAVAGFIILNLWR